MKNSRTIKPFGEVALAKKYITLDQLLHALNTQSVNDLEKGEHKLVGTILYEQGALNLEQFHEVLDYCWFIRANTNA